MKASTLRWLRAAAFPLIAAASLSAVPVYLSASRTVSSAVTLNGASDSSTFSNTGPTPTFSESSSAGLSLVTDTLYGTTSAFARQVSKLDGTGVSLNMHTSVDSYGLYPSGLASSTDAYSYFQVIFYLTGDTLYDFSGVRVASLGPQTLKLSSAQGTVFDFTYLGATNASNVNVHSTGWLSAGFYTFTSTSSLDGAITGSHNYGAFHQQNVVLTFVPDGGSSLTMFAIVAVLLLCFRQKNYFRARIAPAK